MWSDFVSEAMPRCWRPRCPVCGGRLIFTARVSATMRPGGGPPSLDLLPQVSGALNCICGTADPLIPAEHRSAIREGLQAVDPAGERLRYTEMPGAGHGFMCEERSSFYPEASAQGWRLLLEE